MGPLTRAERRDQLQARLARYEWARQQQAHCLQAAADWASRDDGFLQAMVVPPQVPRAYDVHQSGCPIHGDAANQRGLYQWQYSLDRPFKIRCPAGGEEYPSNDYAAFLASGQQDRALLAGDYADDGWGWPQPGEPHRYWFVAYYAHWSMQRELRQALDALAAATWVATDEVQARRLAHKAALLLWQLARFYPDYDYRTQARESREHDPDYTGRITNMIWEVDWASSCAQAYEAVAPYLADDRQLQAHAGLDGAALDHLIRKRLLLTMARDITSGNGRNRGNYGAHQLALVRLAIALDERHLEPTSQAMVNWVLANPRPVVPSDMGLVDALDNLVYRDGMPPESPAYNYIWSDGVAAVLRLLGTRAAPLCAQRRCRQLLLWHYNTLVSMPPLQPPLGDSSDLFSCPGTPGPAAVRAALEHAPDPRLIDDLRARPDALPAELCEDAASDWLAAAPPSSTAPGVLRSRLLPAYGLGMLQADSRPGPTAAVLHYGSWTHHMHRDQLSLLLFAHQNPLLCDVGYPEQTDAFNHRRYGIWSNTIAHNTVTVDARAQERGRGRLHAWQGDAFAQVAEASCAAYPHLEMYRRLVMLVQSTPECAYVFDVFYVRGGSQHDWAVMGPPAEFVCTPALGPVQEAGTLAGAEVPYEDFYDDPELTGKPLGATPMHRYRGSGYQFLVHVQRAALAPGMVAQWRLSPPLAGQAPRPWREIGLRTHLVGDDEEVLAADSQPQRYQHLPRWVKHLIRRRRGPALRSAFVSVHEPFAGAPWIDSVNRATLEPDDGEAVAVRVRLGNGQLQYCFHSLQPARCYRVDGTLELDGQAACVVMGPNGRVRRVLHLNGTVLRCGDLVLNSPGLRRSRIQRIDYRQGTIELAEPVVGADLAAGQTVQIDTLDGSESVTFQQRLGPSSFSIGDEDLRVAGGPVVDVLPGGNRIMTPVSCPHAYPGLTVLNGQGQVQGRVAVGDFLTLARPGLPPLTRADFPDSGDGLGARFAVAIAGPGDEVTLPSRSQFEAE